MVTPTGSQSKKCQSDEWGGNFLIILKSDQKVFNVRKKKWHLALRCIEIIFFPIKYVVSFEVIFLEHCWFWGELVSDSIVHHQPVSYKKLQWKENPVPLLIGSNAASWLKGIEGLENLLDFDWLSITYRNCVHPEHLDTIPHLN